jgi:ParB family chromosome partitioning protein
MAASAPFMHWETAAAVAEFDDDPEAVKQLIVTAQQGQGFLHLLERLRDERKERAAKQPITDELIAAGRHGYRPATLDRSH